MGLSGITLGNIVTLLVSGGATILPMILPIIPPPYNALASAVIAVLGSLYHLNQPAPSSK